MGRSIQIENLRMYQITLLPCLTEIRQELFRKGKINPAFFVPDFRDTYINEFVLVKKGVWCVLCNSYCRQGVSEQTAMSKYQGVKNLIHPVTRSENASKKQEEYILGDYFFHMTICSWLPFPDSLQELESDTFKSLGT